MAAVIVCLAFLLPASAACLYYLVLTTLGWRKPRPLPAGEPRNTGGPAALVSAVGSAIENAVSAGKCRLGRSAALRGSGMAFARGLLERHPWRAFGLTEDAEYGAELAAAGVRVRFLPGV